MKLPIELLENAAREFDKKPRDLALLQKTIAGDAAVILDGVESFALRRSMIAAVAREPAEIAFERYIDGNQLVSINYLQIGAARARPVGRIRYFDKKEMKTAYATGFMVTPELMLTNYHVFPASSSAELANLADEPVIEFDFEFDENGERRTSVVHAIEPDTFFHSDEALDLALVAVHQLDVSGTRRLDEHGYLILNGALGKAGTGDFATIVQHPDGKEKQIALRNNQIIDRTLDDVIIYKSDTAQGSSGAPVFNDEWQVIALHSAGVAKKDSAGNYLDRDDRIIEVEGGRIDEARVVWLSNRGIRTSAVVRHLTTMAAIAHDPRIQVFTSPSYTDQRPFRPLAQANAADSERRLGPAPAPAPAPAVALPPAPSAAPIEIRILLGGAGPLVQAFGGASGPPVMLSASLEAEKKLEDEQDFSRCLGYDEEFLGVRIPMPTPNPRLRKKLASLKDNPSTCVLRYPNFSTVQHAARRVPALSAINVNATLRYSALDEKTRQDHWLRDNRIDYDVQLDDKWYAKSGFDKGHLSRREDAEWGKTMASAKAAADMTCSYANAVPQVPAFNRAIFGYHGKWGLLEQDLLEKGVKEEVGKSGRLCVFSGPIFEDDDPTYHAVQVALSCFKVVVWYGGDGKLKTTAFRLSQSLLVGSIDFEVLHIDKLFKLDQIAIPELERLTGFLFGRTLTDTDTFRAAKK